MAFSRILRHTEQRVKSCA